MPDILSGDRFNDIKFIEKGWSEDKKYRVTTPEGEKYLLRVSPIKRREARKSLFHMMEKVAALGIPMCLPVEFGDCADGVYILLSWIDGEDLEDVLPSLTEAEQYVLGVKSGEIIRKIHSIPAPDGTEEWASRFNRKTDNKLIMYRECGVRFDGDDYVIDYIENNRRLLENRPQCFQHGDYHIGNMMIERVAKLPTEALKIIDFDRYDFGDPWEEFNRIVWSAAASPYFATGQLRGYFGGEPPIAFFRLLAFYIASNTLSSIPWAIPFGQSEVDTMTEQTQEVLAWFDNMRDPVPTWYRKGYEVWDVYNSKREKTGRFHERGKLMPSGDYHIIVQVWKRNSKGEWLIDKRSARYDNNDIDGKWETTGGCAMAGEDSLTAALREAKEELGIALDPSKGTLFASNAQKWEDGHTAFVDVWVFEYDEPIESEKINLQEVCETKWATMDEIRKLIMAGEFLIEWYPYFEELAERLG